MFLVHDTHEERLELIRKLAKIDMAVAVIIAAMYFEWTYRRAILALGCSTTKVIREEILDGATFNDYPRIWNKEVYPRLNIHIEDVLKNFTFKNNPALTLRNKLVHAESGTVKSDYGNEKVEEIISAIEGLNKFALKYYEPLSRKIVRRKPR